MKLGIKPTVDFVFKMLLGNKDHPALTLYFLNSILSKIGEPAVKEVEYLDPKNIPRYLGGKESILDVRVRDETGRTFQVEMQSHLHAALPQRMLGNWAYLYADQLKKRDTYGRYRPVLAVWVLGEDLFLGDQWFHHFLPRDADGMTILHADFRLIVLELGKWKRLSYGAERGIIEDEIERWLSLFTEGEDIDLESIPTPFSTETMREALEVIEMVTRSEIARHTYHRRLDAEMERRDELEDAMRTGMEKGLEQGIEKGIAQGIEKGIERGIREKALEDARKFKELGVSLDIISKATGLCEEEIGRL
jgi:predicted transposase/invertase (TIGR01784 family)